MDPHTPEARPLDYSCTMRWMDSHALLSDALTAIAYVHPSVGALGVRWDFARQTPLAVIEPLRRTRTPLLTLALGSVSAESIAKGLPTLSASEAQSLASMLLLASPLAHQTGTMEWARLLGDSVGLGSSARFDPSFPDGVERGGPAGVAEAERAMASAADLYPALANAALLAGSRTLDGPAQSACRELLAIFESDAVAEASKPCTPADPGAKVLPFTRPTSKPRL